MRASRASKVLPGREVLCRLTGVDEPNQDRTDATNATDHNRLSHSSSSQTFLPPHGGYETLLSFQKARIVYDGTVRFCNRFVDKRSRTHDQMVQAARSGKQNILEGSRAIATSKETELKLTNVARASPLSQLSMRLTNP